MIHGHKMTHRQNMMKISQIRYQLYELLMKLKQLAASSKRNKSGDFNKWDTAVNITKENLEYIDSISKRQGYVSENKDRVAEKLYWILNHLESFNLMYKEELEEKRKRRT